MSAVLERSLFSTSRAAEYFTVGELQAQTGQPRERFAAVVLKELVDNALDAAEAVGVAPEIAIEIDQDGDLLRLTVEDNGGGIAPEAVGSILDFSTRTSDKAAYRAPTRGAQGNALKTVVGIPVALGVAQPVVIDARGVRHEIRSGIDPVGEVRIDHRTHTAPTSPGTRIAVAVPTEDQALDPVHWARGFALFNPHATVRIRVSTLGDPGNEHTRLPRVAGNVGFLPTDGGLSWGLAQGLADRPDVAPLVRP